MLLQRTTTRILRATAVTRSMFDVSLVTAAIISGVRRGTASNLLFPVVRCRESTPHLGERASAEPLPRHA